MSPVADRLGRPQSPCAAPERETEALRAGVVVGSLPGVFLGGRTELFEERTIEQKYEVSQAAV